MKLFEKFFRNHYDIYRTSTGELYMRRWYVMPRGEREDDRDKGGKDRSRWPFSIKLHKICLSDWQDSLHDHPWSAVSFILKGSYDEERFEDNVPGERIVTRRYKPGNINRIKYSDFHKLLLNTDEVWSLFITWKKRQEWGFWMDGEKISHELYDRE